MCVEPLAYPHEPGGDPSRPADEPETQSKEDRLAKRILHGLGFCGHYMHFHGGGISGKAPIVEQAARIRFREQAFSALTHDEREQLAEMLEKIRVTWEELDD